MRSSFVRSLKVVATLYSTILPRNTAGWRTNFVPHLALSLLYDKFSRGVKVPKKPDTWGCGRCAYSTV
eukprot:4998966-Pleurochrysis_carterae.AAC.1